MKRLNSNLSKSRHFADGSIVAVNGTTYTYFFTRNTSLAGSSTTLMRFSPGGIPALVRQGEEGFVGFDDAAQAFLLGSLQCLGIKNLVPPHERRVSVDLTDRG